MILNDYLSIATSMTFNVIHEFSSCFMRNAHVIAYMIQIKSNIIF
ncbi:hypothetical protein XSR1_170024 [Xenorhabdus szentirmaii DSM 16338]|uniref:Uncharacterized protein n=1 Tax=Xenorhabdus szentirmaii DSM 16338 TaxID=1427518 RepID=W1IXI6_9GAMM|nr:hypothetical protein XSR1_170024 [Xenorhabdus szentirmaii DSM 16338]